MEEKTVPAIVPADASAATLHEEALILHNEILYRQEAAASALADFCQSLKKMRDTKLYAELGCESFDEYCERRAGIRARMAYNYIAAYERLGDDFVRRNAAIGITKLEVLSRLSPEDLDEVKDEAGSMSVSELRELQEKLSLSGRQIELLTQELESAKEEKDGLSGELDRLKIEKKEKLSAAQARIEKLSAELTAERKKPQAPAEISEADKKKLRAEGAEKEKKNADAALEKSRAEAARAKERLAKLENEKRAAEDEVARLKKQIANSDAAVSRVKVYWESIQTDFNRMCDVIGEAEPETRAKLCAAADRLLGACRDSLQSIASEASTQ